MFHIPDLTVCISRDSYVCYRTKRIYSSRGSSTVPLMCDEQETFFFKQSNFTLNMDIKFDAHVTVHRDKFLIIKATRCTNFSNLFFGLKLYVFRTVPLSIIRNFSLYTQQWYMSYRLCRQFVSRSICSCSQTVCITCMTYHCCVYSEKFLMMDRGTVRNTQSFIPKN